MMRPGASEEPLPSKILRGNDFSALGRSRPSEFQKILKSFYFNHLNAQDEMGLKQIFYHTTRYGSRLVVDWVLMRRKCRQSRLH